MGLGGISIWQLFLIFLILVLAVATLPLRHDGEPSAAPSDDAEPRGGEASKTRRARRRRRPQPPEQ